MHDPKLRAHSLGGKLAHARLTGQDTTTIERDLAAARIERDIQKHLAEAPPLTPEQRAHLASVLGGAA